MLSNPRNERWRSIKCQLLCMLHWHMTHRQKLINCILYIHDSKDLKINSNVHTDILIGKKILLRLNIKLLWCTVLFRFTFWAVCDVSAGGLMLGAYRGSQNESLSTSPALPRSLRLLLFSLNARDGWQLLGSQLLIMYLHQDSIRSTCSTSFAVLLRTTGSLQLNNNAPVRFHKEHCDPGCEHHSSAQMCEV